MIEAYFIDAFKVASDDWFLPRGDYSVKAVFVTLDEGGWRIVPAVVVTLLGTGTRYRVTSADLREGINTRRVTWQPGRCTHQRDDPTLILPPG
jgi:hypothetical protein